MTCERKNDIAAAVKAAMRAKDKDRLAVLRMLMSECKRIEVDERIELDDARVLAVLDKQIKQRRESLKQYEEAGRDDLAEVERAEIAVIGEFMPRPLSAAEIDAIVNAAVAESGAESAREMGKVMAIVKPQIQGRADMGSVSKLVKLLLQ